MFDEIYKLREMLVQANIPHTFYELSNSIIQGCQIRLYADMEKTWELDDVIYHNYSHGYSQGLLETYNLGNCIGYETAIQVFVGWVKMYLDAQKRKQEGEIKWFCIVP